MDSVHSEFDGVASRGQLRNVGLHSDRVARQVCAGRWQAFGSAVLLHNSTPSFNERARITMINCGPRAVLTAFTAAQAWGLAGWARPQVHVLAPAGTNRSPLPGLVLHRAADWASVDIARGRRQHAIAPALIFGGGASGSPRTACGLLAAAVQQRLVSVDELRPALARATRTRHRRAMITAGEDIAQGADALSEIDFVALCRRAGLPLPTRQAIRVEAGGRRRYLDVEWRLPDGRVVAAEIDGALHMTARRWYADQLRQNEVVIGGTIVLRFPSVLVRHEPRVVISQLRRALAPLSGRR